MDVAEPESKRQKLERTIRCILPDEFLQPVPTMNVSVLSVPSKKHLTKVMSALKEHSFPELQFLKRVHNCRIILGKDLSDNLLEKLGIGDTCTLEETLTAVPASAPLLRWQHEIATKVWPCKFHPNPKFEALYAQRHDPGPIRYMDAVIELSKSTGKDVGLAVDPTTSKICAIGSDRTAMNPLLHTPMNLIDNVAVSQGGGVYCEVDKEHQKILENFDSNLEFGGLPLVFESGYDNVKIGPYLCTGYDIYLSKEPCLMCAMALTHSRAKRVFFNRNTKEGGLETVVKLHTIKALNHHFEAFQIS